MKTNAGYTGDLKNSAPAGATGLAGADAKCALEFPGFKFARSATILANLPVSPSTSGNGEVRVYGKDGGLGDFSYVNTAPLASGGNLNVTPNYPLAAVYIPSAGATDNTSLSDAWVNGQTSCSGWTDATWGQTGTATYVTPQNCGNGRPLLCCNM